MVFPAWLVVRLDGPCGLFQLYDSMIQNCQAAQLRGLRTLKCSKQETAKAILVSDGWCEGPPRGGGGKEGF